MKKEIIDLINTHWTFDDGQQHTHSWHDKQELLKKLSELEINGFPSDDEINEEANKQSYSAIQHVPNFKGLSFRQGFRACGTWIRDKFHTGSVNKDGEVGLQKAIDWCITNAFNIEGQDGVKYVAIDFEEFRKNFDEWLSSPPTEGKELSEITNEDAMEICKIFGCVMATFKSKDFDKVLLQDDTYEIQISFNGYICVRQNNKLYNQNVLPAYQYLQSKGYKLPKYY